VSMRGRVGLLLAFVVPAWIGAGLADWACHRATNIEHTAGRQESVIHAAMMTEAGIPALLGLVSEVNAGILAVACGSRRASSNGRVGRVLCGGET
jgi:hypothetical protein